MNRENPISSDTPEKQESSKDRREENISKIRELLTEKGVPSKEIDTIVGLVNREVSETLTNAMNPELMFSDIETNAGSEWREISELARVRQHGGTIDEFASEIKQRFPNLEVRADVDNYSRIKVRKTTE